MRSDDVCLIVALDVEMLTSYDLLLCTDRTRIHCDYWHEGGSLEFDWPGGAAAVLLLYGC